MHLSGRLGRWFRFLKSTTARTDPEEQRCSDVALHGGSIGVSQAAVESDLSSEQTLRVLSELSKDHRHGDLTAGPAGAPTFSAQVRFLKLVDETLVLDFPTFPGESIDLARGDVVELRFVQGDQLYRLVATVIRRSSAPLSGPASTIGLLLGRFQELERLQRRETFRVSLLDLPPPMISFTPVGMADEQANGTLIELSETGGKVLVAEAVLPLIRLKQLHRVTFELPGDCEPFVLIARIERERTFPGDGLAFVGISWQLDASWAEARRAQMRVAKFIASHQRKKRRKEE